jgi:hypothetical protein
LHPDINYVLPGREVHGRKLGPAFAIPAVAAWFLHALRIKFLLGTAGRYVWTTPDVCQDAVLEKCTQHYLQRKIMCGGVAYLV